jgi:ATP-dependent DNA helicase RecG
MANVAGRTTEMTKGRLSDLTTLGDGFTTELKRIHKMCRDYGVAEPEIEVSEHWVTTTFKRPTGQVTGEVTGEVWPRPESQPESLETRALKLLGVGPMAKSALSTGLGHKEVSGQLNKVIRLLPDSKTIEYTIRDKPSSRLQKYRLTPEGRAVLEAADGGSG